MLKKSVFRLLALAPAVCWWAGVSAQESLAEAVNLSGGVSVDGASGGDLLGWAVAGDGDYNGDGVNDLVLSAQGFDVPNGSGGVLGNAGAVYVVYGGPQSIADLNLNSLRADAGGDGSRGFVLLGTQTNENIGAALVNAGDVNGDGIDDLLVGSPSLPNPVGGGGAYLLFGRPASDPMPPELDLSTLRTTDGTNSGFGVVLEGSQAGGAAGIDLLGNLDFNADGLPDMILGSNYFGAGRTPRPGLIYVLYGRGSDNPWPDLYRLVNLQSNLATGDEGFAIIGDVAESGLGSRLGNLGDFNGDGIDDLLIGSPSASASQGVANSAGFLIPGQVSSAGVGYDIGLDLSQEQFRETVHRLLGDEPEDLVGAAVAGIGDVNSDGRPDLAVSAPRAGHGGEDSGTVYVLFGRPNLQENIPLAGLLPSNGGDGTLGFVLTGSPGQMLGDDIAGLGDINGDGVDDFAVGATSDSQGGVEAGAVYLVYGRAEGFPAQVEASSLAPASAFMPGTGQKLLGQQAGDKVGDRLAGSLDVDLDGNSELLVGARLVDLAANNDGRVYLVNGEGGAVSGFTGADSRAWFDPARPGEGIMLEVGTLDGAGSLFATWYTYQNGEQLWLAGGPVALTADQRQVTMDLVVTRGTGFGDGFDPESVEIDTWGSVTVVRESCGQLSWAYQGPAEVGGGQRQFQPLLSNLLGLSSCTSDEAAGQNNGQDSGQNSGKGNSALVAGHAGAWWDPARAGEGVVLDLELRGGQPTAFFSWFTYHQGVQRWLVGSAPFDPASGQILNLSLVEPAGASFGPDFDPADVVNRSWGGVDLQFSACDGLTVDFNGAFDAAPGVVGTASLTRFTGPLFNLTCP